MLSGVRARLILPPGTPKDRVEILEKAFHKTYRDPEFHKEPSAIEAATKAAPYLTAEAPEFTEFAVFLRQELFSLRPQRLP